MKRYKITRRLKGLDFVPVDDGWERVKPVNKVSKYYWTGFDRYSWRHQLRIEYVDNKFHLYGLVNQISTTKTYGSKKWYLITKDEDLQVIINFIEWWLQDQRHCGRKNEWWFHTRKYLDSPTKYDHLF